MEATFLALPGHFPAPPPRCCRDINSAVLSRHFFNPMLTPTSDAHAEVASRVALHVVPVFILQPGGGLREANHKNERRC